MIYPVYDIQTHVYLSSTGETVCDFSFVHDNDNIGGYHLYISLDNVTFTKYSSKIDYVHRRSLDISTIPIGNRVLYREVFPPNYSGKRIWFYFISISTSLEESVQSDIKSFIVYHYPVSDLRATYDGYKIYVTWNDLYGGNVYKVRLYQKRTIEGSRYDSLNSKLYNDQFHRGRFIWVYDEMRHSQWYGIVNTFGEFDMHNTKNVHVSDNSVNYKILIDNLSIGTTQETSFFSAEVYDRTFEYSIEDSYMDLIVSVVSVDSENKESLPQYVPIRCLRFEEVRPYLRTPENSNTPVLKDGNWRVLASYLVDDGYYDTSMWTLPFSSNVEYHLKGYLGVSNCYVDVFINGMYAFTTSTGYYGDFDIYYKFGRSDISMYFQARTFDNRRFSKKSRTYLIKTKNLYMYYSVLTRQFRNIYDQVQQMKKELSYENQSYGTYLDRYAPLLGIYKFADEDSKKFLDLTHEYLLALLDSTYDRGLFRLLDAFQRNVDEFDHYEFYPNLSLYGILDTSRSFVPLLDQGANLVRGDYWYGVASCRYDGAITPPSYIRVDCRWWHPDFRGITVLKWTEAINTDYYIIYKGTDKNKLGKVVTTDRNIWIDNGTFPIDYGVYPKDMNFTSLEPPRDFTILRNIYLTSLSMWLKTVTQFVIIIYSKASTRIPSFQIDRLRLMLHALVPPEFKYYLIHATDTTTEIYSGV